MLATEVSMSLSVESIKNLPKVTLYGLIFTVASIAGSVAIVVLLLLPLRERSVTVRKEVADLQKTLSQMKSDVKTADEEAEKTSELKTTRDHLVNTGMLKPDPVSNSLRMGAKSLMMPIAMKAGFKLENVKDLPAVLLRLPSPVSSQIYARQPVEFIGRGSFDQIIQFVQETETTYPLTILSSLVIITQPQSSESHKAVITFEWPAKHEWSR
jgi:cell division protein FtsL